MNETIMRILWWILGIIKDNRIRNKCIGDSEEISSIIVEKMIDNRLIWLLGMYEVMRHDRDNKK